MVLWSRGGEPGGPSWSPALPPASVLALPAPPGLYGHSAVYHEATDSLYVFGGFRFHVELAAPSPELYSLHCPDRTWSLLAPSQGAKVRKKGQTDVSAGAGGGPPPFPVPQGVAQSRIPTPPPFQYSPPPRSPLLLSDLEVRINHQEVRGLGADLVLQLLGMAQTGPSPSWLPQL